MRIRREFWVKGVVVDVRRGLSREAYEKDTRQETMGRSTRKDSPPPRRDPGGPVRLWGLLETPYLGLYPERCRSNLREGGPVERPEGSVPDLWVFPNET